MSGPSKYLLPGNGVLPALLIFALLFSISVSYSQTTASDRKFTIEAKAGKGGEIDPSGKVRVELWQSQTFRIIPDDGYAIQNVKVDGEDLGPLESYTFRWVRSNHKIEAFFTRLKFTITASAGPGGKIDPSGEVEVKGGDDRNFKIIPDNGYEIADVLVDGISQGPVEEYRFNDVVEDHEIEASFSRGVAIREVSIPDQPMKIGDVVPVTLAVEDDHGDTYTLISGSVGGYPLSGIQRVSSTAYASSFTVTEGGESYNASQQIPVTDLVISNASGQSPRYDADLNQSNDPIDASRPRVRSISVEPGIHKIGDVVILYIEADGTGYGADLETSVNGISIESPRVSFSESGDGRYTLSYTVSEGDQEVDPQERTLQASLMLTEPSGNQGEPFSTIDNASQLSIDTKAPVVTRMEVPSIAVGPGGIVQVNLLADGTGYTAGTGTMINGIPLSSDRVSFSEGAYGAYTLSYEIGPEDPQVPEGGLDITVVPVDLAGNRGTPYSSLETNYLEIYTTLPEATLAGPPEICKGEEFMLGVSLEGRRPLSFTLNDGTQTTEYQVISSNDYQIPLTPETTTTYRIEKVVDVNGVENTGSGEVQVLVNEGTEVDILPLASGYSVEADPVPLKATVEGGTFTGPGVVSSTGMFYPELAGISDTPHTLVYTYQNDGGCPSADSVEVYVMGSEAMILMPAYALCSDQEPVEVVAMNLAGREGSFNLLDSTGQSAPGLEDHQDNTATLDPSRLEPGDYEIEFRYVDGEEWLLSTSFSFERVRQPLMLDFEMESICQNVLPIALQSDMDGVVFEGTGVTGSEQDGFYFNPGQTVPGKVMLYATHISENGCQAVTEKEMEILPVPRVDFEMSTACIPAGGEMVSFRNLSTGITGVESWSWDFGDPASGPENQSSLKHPTHFYEEPGQKEITLTASTQEGCIAIHSIDSLIDSNPVADFTWVSDCQPRESGIQFINRSDYGSASADSILWRFYDSGGALLQETVMQPERDTITYAFSGPGTYWVDLYTTGSGGCYDLKTQHIDLRPTLRLDKEGYAESFDATDGGWTIHSEDESKSWTWGTPDFSGYDPEPGDQAWYTQLPSGEQDYLEHSWVMSPCFDFSDMERPVIRMNIMKSFVPFLNGAVVQFRDGREKGWKTIGENTSGVEWYNSDDLTLQPGGSHTGWGLEVFDPDRTWVTAMHDLDRVAGLPHVLLRVAFASGGKEAMGNQGFAFDDVRIAERSKLSVLEHFTDYSDENSRLADQRISELGKELRKDVIDLQYHISYNGMDPMFAINPDPASARAFNFGISQVPFTVLDGGTNPNHRFTLKDLQESSPKEQIRRLTLEEPLFDLHLEVDWGEEGMEARTSVSCRESLDETYIQLFVIVFETSVTSYNTTSDSPGFRNVVLDMLPSPAGTLLGDRWHKGTSVQQTDTWSYRSYVEDRDELAVAAFVQDRNTGQILQAAVQYRDQTVDIPAGSPMMDAIRVYPNPAGPLVYVSLGSGIQENSRLELLDMGGKWVTEVEVPSGTQMVTMPLELQSRGIYLIRWTNGAEVLGLAKLVKIQ